MDKLKRRMRINIKTDQAVKAYLEFVPGEKPYIHFCAEQIKGYNSLSGFIDDKDSYKLMRMAESLP